MLSSQAKDGLAGTVSGAVGPCLRAYEPTSLAPARLLPEPDPQRGLADDLVHQERIGRMEPPAARVTEQAFHLIGPEHAAAAGHLHRQIDDLPARLHRMMLGGNDLGRPGRAVIHAG